MWLAEANTRWSRERPQQLGHSAEHPLGIRLAPLLAGALVLVGFALWPRYRLTDTINRDSVTAAGLLRPAV